MTDEEIQPDETEQGEEQNVVVQQAIQQAHQYHSILDMAKQWSRETATEIRIRAAMEDDDEAAAELEEIARLVVTVTERIEQGDNTRSRQPMGG